MIETQEKSKHHVSIRLCSEELSILNGLARRSNATVSQYLRALIMRKVVVSAEIDNYRPLLRRRPPKKG